MRCFFRLNDEAKNERRVTIFWLQWYSAKCWWQQLVLRTRHLPERNTTNPALASTEEETADFADYKDFYLVVASNDCGLVQRIDLNLKRRICVICGSFVLRGYNAELTC